MAEGMYQADGTIHVRFGGTSSVVTFIPDKYVEQGGSKFVVFVPWGKVPKRNCEVEIDGLVVRACGSKGVELHVSSGLIAQEAGGSDENEAEGTSESGHAANRATPYNDLIPGLLEAAVKPIKVTVLVSHQEGQLTLEEAIIPAIPAKPAT